MIPSLRGYIDTSLAPRYHPVATHRRGPLAKRKGSGLQIRHPRFESGRGLFPSFFLVQSIRQDSLVWPDR
jgi:hypothetical protein